MRCFIENEVSIEFSTAEEVKDFFGLDRMDDETMAAIEGKHVCVCPYTEDVHNERVLMWADSASDLEHGYREACDDI